MTHRYSLTVTPAERPHVADRKKQTESTAGAAPEVPAAADDLSAYRQAYVEETREELDALVEALLALESNAADVGALNEAFRLVHSMKGSSALMGFAHAGELAHRWEDLLDRLRSGDMSLDRTHIDLMLRCVDALRAFVVTLSAADGTADADPEVTQVLVRSLQAAIASPAVKERAPIEPRPLSATEHRMDSAATNVFSHLELLITFAPQLQLPDLKARLIASRLADFGEIVHVEPDFDQTAAFEAGRQFRLTLLTRQALDEIRSRASVDGVTSIEIKHLSGVTATMAASIAMAPTDGAATAQEAGSAAAPVEPNRTPDGAAPEPTAASTSAPSETIRVEVLRLDRLMKLTGELIVNQEGFRELAREMGSRFRRTGATDPGQSTESWDHATRCGRRLADAVDQLARVSDALRRAVMETRMVPLAPLFNRFKRVVRDLSTGTGKQVELRIHGEQTELDKRMIDELADPLIHLVRNAIDHGIEPPLERERIGKPATARVTLSASHRGNNVYISVADDGRGIDVDRIRARLVERELLSAPAARELSDAQAAEYIWHPGFSTAGSVTDLSGRGVGMDIVRNRINALCGTIDITFQPGQGTTFTIRLPLTLAIIPSLLLRIGRGTFSVPLDEVREIARVPADRIVTVHGRRAIELRGEFVPVIRLGDVFRWNSSRYTAGIEPAACRPRAAVQVVVLRVTGNSVGLEVDAPLGVSELVIKSLADHFLQVPGLSGASILGSGEISLMLDSAALADMARPGLASGTRSSR